MNPDAHLRIFDLAARFGVFSLGPIRMNLNRGEYVVLLGPTGSGKTSMLRVLAGIAPGSTGEIRLAGTRIDTLPPHRRNIGYVSQGGDLFPHLTVRENLAFGLAYLTLERDEKRKRIAEYLERFRLTSLSGRRASSLSGGEGKRCAMARALILEPRLLLLDEPLGMLDHNSRRAMVEILRMIHDDLKTTTIHVTHDRQEAWLLGDACAVMGNGSVLQFGPVADLFRKPRSADVADFLGGGNLVPATFCEGAAETPLGAIRTPGVVRDGQGWILLRPERIRLVPWGRGFPVRIVGTRDLGDHLEITVTVPDSEFSMVVYHSGFEPLPEAGTVAAIDWPDDAVHVIFPDNPVP